MTKQKEKTFDELVASTDVVDLQKAIQLLKDQVAQLTDRKNGLIETETRLQNSLHEKRNEIDNHLRENQDLRDLNRVLKTSLNTINALIGVRNPEDDRNFMTRFGYRGF